MKTRLLKIWLTVLCILCAVLAVACTKKQSAHEHTYVVVTAEYSCGNEGYVEYGCTGCDNSYKERIAALHHGYTDWFDISIDEKYTDVSMRYCFVCKEVQYKKGQDTFVYGYQEFLDIINNINCCLHRNCVQEDIEYPPTCTESGVQFSMYCNDCQSTIYTERISPLGHDFEETGKVDGIECLFDVQCLRCGTTDTQYIHTWGATQEIKPATCTEDGIKKTTCTVCGIEDMDSTLPKGHVKVETIVTEATCTHEGEKSVACSRCDYIVTEPIAQKPHDPDNGVVLKKSTCRERGVVLYTCKSCDTQYVKELPIEHKYKKEEVIQEATCIVGGKVRERCRLCGISRVQSSNALGHDTYVDWEESATCTANGVKHIKCTRCNYEREKPQAALGHDMYVAEEIASTCTVQGIRIKKCKRCAYQQDIPLSLKEHTKQFTEQKSATCTQDGYRKYTCSVCKTKGQDIVDALGHKYDVKFDEHQHSATCTRTACNETIEVEKHTFYVDVNIINAQENGEPRDTYIFFLKCSGLEGLCAYSKEIARIQVDVHEGYTYDITRPTCTQEGLFIVKCNVCQEEFSRVIISATGHYYDYDGKCIYCGEMGYNGLSFTLNADGASYSIARGTSTERNICIPAYYNGLPVTKVADNGFIDADVRTIFLGENIQTIGESAFAGCRKLTDITLSNRLQEIGENAFASCVSLTNVYITSLEGWCRIDFANAYSNPLSNWEVNLYVDFVLVVHLVIPNGVSEIKKYAFYNYYRLESVTISNSVQSIGEEAFYSCDRLTLISIGNGVKTIGVSAFSDLDGLISIVIPNSVQFIGESAFYGCGNLTNVTMGEGVQTIDVRAFGYCENLTNVYITNIAKWCMIDFQVIHGNPMVLSSNPLYYAKNLYVNNVLVVNLVIPNGVTEIKSRVFYGYARLTSVILSDDVQSIGVSAFEKCVNLTSITLGSGLQSVDINAFSACYRLVEVINRSTLSIVVGNTDYGFVAYYAKQVLTTTPLTSNFIQQDEFLFYNANGMYYLVAYMGSAEEIELPNTVNGHTYRIKSYAFYYSSFARITMPSSITAIEGYAFYHCDVLLSLTIPDSVTSLVGNTFYDCSVLSSIHIPDSVTLIADYAFYECYALASIVVSEGNAYYASQDGILYNKEKTQFIYIPKGVSGTVIIPDSIREIEREAFARCVNLTNIILPEGLETIGIQAFDMCWQLTHITIPSSVQSIGTLALAQNGLVCISVDENNAVYTSIDGNLYTKDGKTLVQYVRGKTATEVVLPSGITTIGEGAFFSCINVTSIIIPEEVQTIEKGAFFYCINLTSIVIPNSVTVIERKAFEYCESLTAVYYKGTESEWNAISIESPDYYEDDYLTADRVYYYSETQPVGEGKYWRYVDGVPTSW